MCRGQFPHHGIPDAYDAEIVVGPVADSITQPAVE
ncbi:MAG: hypothetical protein QOJ64_4440, partial [Acidobacteriota bacterium]|nr:hypothetical protein [Acidobacteriota bacterium]